MDWNSDAGRELLWAAYPEGYLPMRGVLTVGGRLITDPTGSLQGHACLAGDLLPDPDPTDAATWACLLADLWAALGGKPCAGLILCAPDNYGESWYIVPGFRSDAPEESYIDLPGVCYGDPQWWRSAAQYHPGFAHATRDPAEALVRARASLRNNDKK